MDIENNVSMPETSYTENPNLINVYKIGPGSYTVAPNLILRVKPSGSRSWVFRYTKDFKVKEIGLGIAGIEDVTKEKAENLAFEMRKKLKEGVDPKSIILLDKKDKQIKSNRTLEDRVLLLEAQINQLIRHFHE